MRLDDHLSAIKGIIIAGYGAIILIMAVWIIYRGSHEDWGKRIPGRVVLGLFLLHLVYWIGDVTVILLRYGRSARATESATDPWSVYPLAVGLVFGIWAAIRFFRNTVGSPTNGEA